jgi:hypothetical protein
LASLVGLVLTNNQIHPFGYERDIDTVKRAQCDPTKAASEANQQRPIAPTGQVIRQAGRMARSGSSVAAWDWRRRVPLTRRMPSITSLTNGSVVGVTWPLIRWT